MMRRIAQPPTGKRGLFGAAALGALSGLGQAPWDVPVLTVVGLGVLFAWLGAATSVRRAAGLAWGFGAGYFALTLHWIVFPFLVEPDVYGWMAPFALAFMAAGLALFWAASGALAAWFGRGALGAAAAFLLAEVLRSSILTGFPWVLLGHIWIDTPFAQLSAFAGPYGLTLITVMLAACVARVLTRTDWRPLVVIAAFAATGPFLAPGDAPMARSDARVVRLVQPNAPQSEKWDPDRARDFYARMVVSTGAATPPDLIVWPETALPYLLEYADESFARIALAARGAPVILGINRRGGDRYYNSLVALDETGGVAGIYDKRHLVPFGEYIPFGEILARVGIHGLAQSQGGGFSQGTGAAHMTLPDGTTLLPLICYEGIFASDVRRAVRDERPDLMVLITNDAWFGSGAGPRQHLAQARLRAIETGVPMVRVANTGISAMIDAEGRLTAQIAMDVDGWTDAPLPSLGGETLYLRVGDLPVLLLLGAALLGLGARRSRNPIDRGGRPD